MGAKHCAATHPTMSPPYPHMSSQRSTPTPQPAHATNSSKFPIVSFQYFRLPAVPRKSLIIRCLLFYEPKGRELESLRAHHLTHNSSIGCGPSAAFAFLPAIAEWRNIVPSNRCRSTSGQVMSNSAQSRSIESDIYNAQQHNLLESAGAGNAAG